MKSTPEAPVPEVTPTPEGTASLAPVLVAPGRGRLTLLVGAVVALLVLATLLGLADLRELSDRAADADWGLVALAAVAALVSHAGIALSEQALLHALGYRVRTKLMLCAVMVSVSANRNLRSGGASGIAMLSWLLGRAGVPASAVVAVTVGHLVMTNALMALAFGLGLVSPWLEAGAAEGGATTLHRAYAVVGATFVLTLGGMSAALAFKKTRDGLARLTGWLLRHLPNWGKRDAWAERAERFVHDSTTAASTFVVPQRDHVLAWILTTVRVATSIAALWLCLAAAGIHVGPAIVLLAYAAGKSAGILSFIPAGLGVVEASLAGVLSALGAPWEAALLAALLHRAAYHVVPTLAGLALLRKAITSSRQAPTANGAAPVGSP